MIRRSPALLALAATLAMLVGACNTSTPGPALTDPKEIVTAALKSTEAATSVHIDVSVDGKAAIKLPTAGGTGTTIDLSGTTASIDLDLAKHAAKARFSVPNLLSFGGEIIAVDGKTYVKTTLTGPLYQESVASASPVDPSNVSGMIDGLGDALLKNPGALVKGEDASCGSEQCYTVTTTLSPDALGLSAVGAAASLPIDLTGATVKVTAAVEKDLPYHLAGVTAVLTMSDGNTLTVEATMSKWDQPVSITAPPADQVKPAS